MNESGAEVAGGGAVGAASPQRYRLKSWGARLALAAVSLLLTLGVLEVAARAYVKWRYGDAAHGMNWRFAYEPYLLTRTDERLHREVPAKGGSLRVLMVGGSTAALVPDALLASELEAALRRPVEVINLGQGGYILNQERIALLLHGLKLQPDLVITLDGANDLVTASKTGEPGLTYSNGFIELAVERPWVNALFGAVRHSQFVNCLNKLRERRAERRSHGDERVLGRTVEHVREALESITAMSRGKGAAHLAVVQPYLYLRTSRTAEEEQLASAFAYRGDYMSRGFRALAARLREASAQAPGRTLLDATGAFDGTSEACFIDEVHLTEAGNRLLCRHIAAAVAGMSLQPPELAGAGR